MKTLWCWRCRQAMPMLDEGEFDPISRLYSDCIRSAQRAREQTGVPVGDASVNAMFEPVRLEYERLTGVSNCHHNAVMHHRISIYGPPCWSCGKPLRTPQARHCAACGLTRE